MLCAIGQLCFGLLCFGLLSTLAFAQEIGDTPRLPVPGKTPNVLTPGVLPDAILMRNEMGDGIFVPKSRYEEFEQFLRDEVDASPTALPIETLEQIDIAVLIDKNVARLKVGVQARLSEPNKRWLSVPLGLGLVQAIPSTLPGESLSAFPPIRISNESTGYIWKIEPGQERSRRLAFEALCNVTTTSQGQAIRLDLPNVPTTLRLKLPNGQWELNLTGTGSEVVEPFLEVDSMSVAIVRTSGGPVTLNWSRKIVADQIQSIEVESKTTYSPIPDTGLFRAVAKLAIRGPKSLGGRRFLITLPKDSLWREPFSSSIPFKGYRLSKSEPSQDGTDTTLKLEFEEAVSQTNIEISVEWQTTAAPESDSLEFAIPNVEGVQRHVGEMDLVVPRNVKFQWEPQQGIQFTKQLSDGGDALTYNFRFHQQTTPLHVQWSTGDRVSKLKAAYNIVYDQPNLQLSGIIEFVDDIRQLPFLQLDVQGWSVDRVQIQPSGRYLDLVANRSTITIDTDGNPQNFSSIALSLSELLEALPNQPSGSSVNSAATEIPTQGSDSTPVNPIVPREESRMQAPRGVSFVLAQRAKSTVENQEQIRVALPMLSWIDPESQKRSSVCVGGELTIQSSTSTLSQSESNTNSILSWSGSDLPNLNNGVLSGRPPATNWRSVLKYRVNSSDAWAHWNGTALLSHIVIQARAESTIAVGEEWLDVTQTWKLNSQGRIPKTLRLAIPKEWRFDSKESVESLRVNIDNIPVNIQSMEDASFNSDNLFSPEIQSRYYWKQLILPASALENANQAQEKKLTVRMRSPNGRKESAAKLAFDWALPILVADKAEDSLIIEHFSGELRPESNVRCLLKSPKSDRSDTDDKPKENTSHLQFDCTQQDPRLVGELLFITQEDETKIHIESVWLQSILNAVEHRERFVVRFHTNANSISLDLPVDRFADTKVLLNGRRAVSVSNAGKMNRLDVALDGVALQTSGSNESSYVLEVFMWPATKSQWITSLRAQPPKIWNCNNQAYLIWQVVVPATAHLVGSSASLSPGYRWEWKDLWFSRRNEWTQAEIERQMGATSQPNISPQSNQYIFLSLNQNASMEAWLAPRYLLWIPVAIFLLIGSFFVMEFRWIRKPWLGIGLLLVSLAFSQWAWDLSVALVQSLIAAIGISVLYLMMKWVVDRRTRRRSVFASRISPSLVPSAPRTTPPASLSGSSRLLPNAVPSKALPVREVKPLEPPSTAIASNMGEVQ
ncbi:MAG: hypothetical protein K9M08_07015 [Pirellula sp.]|nr:hypothetical protein [Pirellula sp.]